MELGTAGSQPYTRCPSFPREKNEKLERVGEKRIEKEEKKWLGLRRWIKGYSWALVISDTLVEEWRVNADRDLEYCTCENLLYFESNWNLLVYFNQVSIYIFEKMWLFSVHDLRVSSWPFLNIRLNTGSIHSNYGEELHRSISVSMLHYRIITVSYCLVYLYTYSANGNLIRRCFQGSQGKFAKALLRRNTARRTTLVLEIWWGSFTPLPIQLDVRLRATWNATRRASIHARVKQIF